MARWTREELLLALGLYCETPFGRQHKGYPPIIEMASTIGRTPSAVAMKLNNFTSLDPLEAARGITGLTGASNLDREIWSEFENNREHVVESIEELREQRGDATAQSSAEQHPRDVQIPSGPTTREATVTQRRHQRFFRRVVLASYDQRCCVTGLPVPALLRASHIVPWSQSTELRLNPRNGLCLSATFDAAFDRGLISFDENFRLLIGTALQEQNANGEVSMAFVQREGLPLKMPEKNLPDSELMQWHVENVFEH